MHPDPQDRDGLESISCDPHRNMVARSFSMGTTVLDYSEKVRSSYELKVLQSVRTDAVNRKPAGFHKWRQTPNLSRSETQDEAGSAQHGHQCPAQSQKRAKGGHEDH